MGGKIATYIRLEKDDRDWFEKLAAKEKRTLSAMLRVVLVHRPSRLGGYWPR